MSNEIVILGREKIIGEIQCGGAKNLVTKVIVASILSRSKNVIENVPNIVDVMSVIKMAQEIGIKIEYDGNKMIIDSTEITNNHIDKDELGSRISILFLSVLGHFFNEVSVPMPVGCDLGDRTVDMHLDILHKFGFKVTNTNGICLIQRSADRIIGANIHLSYPSVGATETAIMLAVLAKGKSTIKGIAIEPEINSLILFLQKCGALIRYVGDRELLIQGVESLSGCNFKIMGDRIEAAAWACFACATDGEITVSGIDPHNLVNFFGPFMSMGGGFKVLSEDKIMFFRQKKDLQRTFIETGPYPMFSTDYQPMFAAMMMQAKGSSIIHETLFTKRLEYLANLQQFGLNYTLDDMCYGHECRFSKKNHIHSAILSGCNPVDLEPVHLRADTIRSGFAYIIASVTSGKPLYLSNIQIIERGFEDIVGKLRQIGVKVERAY